MRFRNGGLEMFGYVMANVRELTKDQRQRYGSIYCGICRRIRAQSSASARLTLSYDMAFLALLLMSLYEPEESSGSRACGLHPVKPRPWTDSEYIRYGADMNVALAYYNAMDDYYDDRNPLAKALAGSLEKRLPEIRQRYPRQCEAMELCIRQLSQLEKANCPNPDLPATCFGALMGQLLVYREDRWSENLRQLGMALGRYIYLADAAVDYRRDARKKKYNPFLAKGTGPDPAQWENYLILAMGRCTEYYERLPLVQDKALLDNILYSGIWMEYRRRQRGRDVPQEEKHDR